MRSLFNHLEMKQFHRYLLWFLVIDLAVSALVLVALMGVRQGMVQTMPTGDLPSPPAVVAGMATAETDASTPMRQELRMAQKQVRETSNLQAETMEELIGGTYEAIRLEELEQIAPEAYDECVKALREMRETARRQVERRQPYLANLDASRLPPEEFQEFRDALNYLQECELCLAENRALPPPPPEYDWRKLNRLTDLAERYCLVWAGCREDASHQQDVLFDNVLSPDYFGYKFISTKSVWEAMHR